MGFGMLLSALLSIKYKPKGKLKANLRLSMHFRKCLHNSCLWKYEVALTESDVNFEWQAVESGSTVGLHSDQIARKYQYFLT